MVGPTKRDVESHSTQLKREKENKVACVGSFKQTVEKDDVVIQGKIANV